MSIEALGIIKNKLHALGINYEINEWTKKPIYPYFVGEYTENESITEDGLQETQFTLNGFTRGKWLELEQAKETIEHSFKDGDMTITDSGSGVVIFYANSLVIPTGDAELKRIQIVLKIKEWKVN